MKKYSLKLFILTFIILITLPKAYAQERIIDNASLLNINEKATLSGLIDTLSRTYNFDFIILTEKNIGSKTPMEYAADFFDNNGYGFGNNRDGCIFLQVTDSRDYWFSTSGRGIKIFTSSAEKKTESEMVKYLQAGDYYSAYYTILYYWEKFLELDAKGRRYNFFHEWNILLVIISWALSFLIGLGVVSGWRKGMNTALMQTQASAYVVPGSLAFKVKDDKFLFSTVTKTKIQSNSNNTISSGGGGGRSHTSSSGRSHGGGGGKY
ncbi:MAG: TPM domain-containing protein [Treponema sp.]|nr:TPM domain-containing protein [Treponema sp.]MCL2250681.1 TPM domain-containing protein [Treponema sp.]